MIVSGPVDPIVSGMGSLTKEVDRKQDSHVGRGFGDGRMARQDIFRMIKKRCRNAALGTAANCHTFRATGITTYLLNGGFRTRAGDRRA